MSWYPQNVARAFCTRCLRPESACYCSALPTVDSRTRVVFLQHPRERRVAIGTCRMAHLALPNSELHVGVRFDGDARIESLARDEGTAVLFPGGRPPSPDSNVRTLVVVDGTWTTAKKVLERNRVLRELPRIGLLPERPGNYRIRREPAPHCLSTIEAVAEVLGQLEGEPDRFRAMLRAFDRMIDLQLEWASRRASPPRYKRRRQRERRVDLPAELALRASDLVAVYAEANAHAMDSELSGAAELVHLVAERVSTGERFEAVLAPRLPLAASTPVHLELPASQIAGGEPAASALARWSAFVRPDDVFCGWGAYALKLLYAEGVDRRPAVDIRLAVSRHLKRRAGGVEQAAQLLSQEVKPWTAGRAGRRIAALAAVIRALSAVAVADAMARVA